MPLSVADKNHWRNRIAHRIEQRIETIYSDAPHIRGLVDRESLAAALESLGLTAITRRLAEIETISQQLDQEERQLRRAELALVRGVPSQRITDNMLPYSGPHQEVQAALKRRQELHAQRILAREDLGRTVLRLEQEKERLVDQVWLATHPAQLLQLWEQTNRLLGETTTPPEEAPQPAGSLSA